MGVAEQAPVIVRCHIHYDKPVLIFSHRKILRTPYLFCGSFSIRFIYNSMLYRHCTFSMVLRKI